MGLAVLLAACWTTAAVAQPAAPDPRWALVVSGASGGAAYAEQMARWRREITEALTGRFGFRPAQVVQLVDETARTAGTLLPPRTCARP